MIERTGTVYAPLSIFLLSEAYVRNENIDWLKVFSKIKKLALNVYKDPRISDKANRSFFKAMYDYLNKNEIKILKELKTYDFIECLKNIMKGENLNGKYD